MRVDSTGAVATVVAVALVSLGGVTVSLVLALSDGGAGAQRADAILSATVVAVFTIVGTVVAAARPANRVGWVMLAGAALWAVGNAGADLATRGIVAAPGSVPGVAAWALAGSALRGTGWYVVVIGVPMTFPDGHLAGPRWRWLPRTFAISIACTVLGVLLATDADLTGLGRWRNPIAVPASAQFLSGLLSFSGVALGLVATVGSVLQLRERWRHGGPVLRQQLVLLSAAVALTVVAAPIALATGHGWVFSAAALPLPIAIAFAVLGRGLYDLKTAANRALVWSTLSVAVAGAYALVIVGLTTLLHLGSTAWLPWVAAGVIAVSFAPLRDAVQHTINRLTYGAWDDPYAVLAVLGQRLEASADADRLLADAVAELTGLGLTDVSIRDIHGTTLAGTQTPSGSMTMKLVVYGRPVGTLSFRAPAGDLRRRDYQLIADLAGQLGGVLENRELVVDLQDALERLVRAREEERRRLRRDLHDGLGPALAGHTLRLDLIANKLRDGQPIDQDITDLRKDLRATVLEVRHIVEALRPPALDNLGLSGALSQVVQRLSAGSPTAIVLNVAPLPNLPAAVEVAAFRVTTEAVTNAVRHSGALTCTVGIDAVDDLLRIAVCDDGVWSANGDGAGNGLHTMRERVEELRGEFRIDSEDGTRMSAWLPLSAAVRVPGSGTPR